MGRKTIATNRKAFRDYFIDKKWECGIALKGSEVKSLRAGQVNFKNSFARIEDGEIYLHDLYISPYKEASYLNPEADRPRKLLLHRREIDKIDDLMRQKGFALIPTLIYFNERGIAKVELGLGKGKKSFDKREDLKKRAIEIGLKRALGTRRK